MALNILRLKYHLGKLLKKEISTHFLQMFSLSDSGMGVINLHFQLRLPMTLNETAVTNN